MNLDAIRSEVREIMIGDPAHDFSHIMRVFKNAELICQNETRNVQTSVVLAATLLHDVVSLPKSSQYSRYSADYSASKAKEILKRHGVDQSTISKIASAISDHSYSKGRVPDTLEGKILQDADRLDALGAIGIARSFSVGGLEKREMYHSDDPFCTNRTPDDYKWTLDHFYKKLLLLEGLMHTKTAKIEAQRRSEFLKKFLAELQKEIQP